MPVQEPPSTHERSRGRPALSDRIATRWTRLVASLPMTGALLSVAAVWILGAVWSFTEQKAFAGDKGFTDTPILPLVFDGFAFACALVAYAASLDGRPAVPARLATVLGVAASAASNGVWAAQRSTVNHVPDWTAVTIGVGVPVFANIAFEVLLAELRRQVQRRRGMPAPAVLPSLRLIRLVLAPLSTFTEWRAEVLARTATVALPASERWGGVDEALPPPAQSSTPAAPELPSPEPRHALEPAPTSPVLHLMPPPEAVDTALDARMDAAEAHVSTDPLLVPGAPRTSRQQRRVAQQLGVTRTRSDMSVDEFNAAIDDHIRTYGPNRAAS